MTLMDNNPLGKPTQYINFYAPDLLFKLARSDKRNELSQKYLDFNGEDIWNVYELSWLNPNGLPQVAIAEFRIDADSEFIIESKSLKLYLNSFNQTTFENGQKVSETISEDLTRTTGKPVDVILSPPGQFDRFRVNTLEGELIDTADIQITEYDYNPGLLQHSTDPANPVEETLVSHLLKSNCLITNQPDWASIQIKYCGAQIRREKLLQYLVSFRTHNEFHEQCVERIYGDIKRYCDPPKLTVYARYTRRGGLDINPWRSDFELKMPNLRLARQ